MDIAQRWDIWEIIAYIILKYLWLSIDKPVNNSDDRWFDLRFDYKEFDIKAQIKSVNISNITVSWNYVKYDFLVKNNNKLFDYIQGNEYRRSLLILVVIPENETDLLELSEEEIIMKCKVYWLKTFERSDNENTIRIDIPKVNQVFEWWVSNLSNILNQWIA